MLKTNLIISLLCGGLLCLPHSLYCAQAVQLPAFGPGQSITARPTPEGPLATAQDVDALVGEIDKRIADAVEKASAALDGLKTLFTKEHFNRILGSLSYRTTKEFSLLSKTGDGFAFSFGYSGHGDISKGFEGIEPALRLSTLPDFLQPPLKAAFAAIGFEKLLTKSPAREWSLKVMLLLKDLVGGKIGPSAFVTEFNLLLVRLLRTQQDGKQRYPTFKSVLDELSPLVQSLLQSLNAPLNDELFFEGGALGADKPLLSFMEGYYALIKSIATMTFSRTLKGGAFVDTPGYTFPTAQLGKRAAGERLMGLRLAAFAYYHTLNNAYASTATGKAALAAKEQAMKAAASLPKAKKIAAKNKAVRAYNNSIPGFNDLRNFVAIELAGVLDRLQDNRVKNVIAKMIDPDLYMIGLPTFNELLTSIGKKPEDLPPPLPPAIEEAELYDEASLEQQLLGEEPIF